jgi:SARP family transcriptional regulator, regulator of embCAB operon
MIDISLLGHTTVHLCDQSGHADGAGVRIWTKPRQILEILALDPGVPVTKDVLAVAMWGSHPPARSASTVESYVSVLRRHLRVPQGTSAALATTTNGYVLDPEQVRVDLDQVRSGLERSLRSTGETRMSEAERLVDVPVDRLLASEPFETWAVQARHDLGTLAHRAFMQAAHEANESRQPARAVRLARAALRQDEISEAACLELMTALYHTGQTSDALLAYDDLRRSLRVEVGVEPSGTIRELYLRILRDQPHTVNRREVRTLLQLVGRAVAGLPQVGNGIEPEPHGVSQLSVQRAG